MITEEQAIALEQVSIAIRELQQSVFAPISTETFSEIVDTCILTVENASGLLSPQEVKVFIAELHK